MSKLILAPFVAISLLGVAIPASAKDYGEVAGWRLASSGTTCGLYSTKAGNGEIIILKNLDGALHLQVTSKFWRSDTSIKIGFDVDQQAWTGEFGSQPIEVEDGRGYLAAFGKGFEKKLRVGNRLIVRGNGQALGTFSLSGSAAALNRLEFCLRDLRRNGPTQIMTAAAIAAREITPPKPTNKRSDWFRLNDYPRRAQNEGREGTVLFELTVGTNGRVTDCRITKSSGHSDIDESSCKAVSKRARFEAAQDGNGNKIEGKYNSRVSWKIPQ